MPHSDATARLAVPKYWTRSIQAALVHVMSLAHYALVQMACAPLSATRPGERAP